MATVRVSFLLGGERFHGRLNRSSVLSDVPAKATRLNRAGPGYKVIRLRRLCRPQIEALQSSYPRPKSPDLLKRVVAVLPPLEGFERCHPATGGRAAGAPPPRPLRPRWR